MASEDWYNGLLKILQQMGGKAVPQTVKSGRFSDIIETLQSLPNDH